MIKLLEAKRIKPFFTVLLVAVMLVGVTAVAYAITISVDGIQEPVWTTGAGGQLPGFLADDGGNEAAITNDGVDINVVRWTNDQDAFYVLFETYAATDWTSLSPLQRRTVTICIDIDNNTGTGSSFVNCDGTNQAVSMPGIDRYIILEGPTPTITVFDSSFTVVPDATALTVTSGSITELRVSLAALGIVSAATCPGTMPVGIYFDGQTGDPDDNVPDAGQLTFGCGSPTAVTLQNVSASGQSVVLPFALGAFGLIVVSTGLVINRKRKNIQ